VKHLSSSSRGIYALARRRAGVGALVVALAGVWCLRAQSPQQKAPPAVTTAPAMNWVLPLFTDKEGWRTMTLRGAAVRQVDDHLEATDFSMWIFSGKADEKVDTILLSPDAQFFPKEKRAAGSKAVRVIRDDMEVTGTGWNYLHDAKKVSLEKNVRVVFRAQLNDILK
jgi:hypothetical protein